MMKRIAALAAIILLPLACEHADALLLEGSSLSGARARWQALQWQNYSFEQQRHSAWGSQWCRIMVTGKQVTEVLGLNGERLPLTGDIRSIDQIFEWLEELRKQKPDYLAVEYHPRYGHPTKITLNPNCRNTDDELSLSLEHAQAEPQRRLPACKRRQAGSLR